MLLTAAMDKAGLSEFCDASEEVRLQSLFCLAAHVLSSHLHDGRCCSKHRCCLAIIFASSDALSSGIILDPLTG